MNSNVLSQEGNNPERILRFLNQLLNQRINFL